MEICIKINSEFKVEMPNFENSSSTICLSKVEPIWLPTSMILEHLHARGINCTNTNLFNYEKKGKLQTRRKNNKTVLFELNQVLNTIKKTRK